MNEGKDFPPPVAVSEIAKIIHQTYVAVLAYRCEKQWWVFSWASTILLAAIGAMIAIAGDREKVLSPLHAGMLIAAVALVTAFSCWWVHVHWGKENAIRAAATEFEKQHLGIAEERMLLGKCQNVSAGESYPSFLAILCLIAITAVVTNLRSVKSSLFGTPPAEVQKGSTQ